MGFFDILVELGFKYSIKVLTHQELTLYGALPDWPRF